VYLAVLVTNQSGALQSCITSSTSRPTKHGSRHNTSVFETRKAYEILWIWNKNDIFKEETLIDDDFSPITFSTTTTKSLHLAYDEASIAVLLPRRKVASDDNNKLL